MPEFAIAFERRFGRDLLIPSLRPLPNQISALLLVLVPRGRAPQVEHVVSRCSAEGARRRLPGCRTGSTFTSNPIRRCPGHGRWTCFTYASLWSASSVSLRRNLSTRSVYFTAAFHCVGSGQVSPCLILELDVCTHRWRECGYPAMFTDMSSIRTVFGRHVRYADHPSSIRSGQEEYERLRPMSYSKSHVILIAFAIDTPDSLDNVSAKVSFMGPPGSV